MNTDTEVTSDLIQEEERVLTVTSSEYLNNIFSPVPFMHIC
jgi:hypothetical protein